jgi:hypothetical protein
VPNDRFEPLTWHRAVLSEDCKLDPYEAIVMLALVRFANEAGRAFPGFATLCRVTRVSRTKLVSALAQLEARGLFARHRQTRGEGFGANTYELPIEPPTSALQALPTPSGSAPQVLGSAPHALEVVRPANSGSAPHAPYLPLKLLNGTDQVTADAPTSAQQALPKEAKTKRAPTKVTRKSETPLPADWQPTEAHRDMARKNGLDVELEASGFRGHAESKERRAVSWNGAFTTWLTNQVRWNRDRGGRRQAVVVQKGGYAGRPKSEFEQELEGAKFAK